MASTARPSRRFARLRSVPWLRIAGVTLVAVLAVALIPPLRKAAAIGASKVILFAASPMAPKIADLHKLPETTTILASDGSVLARLDNAQHRDIVRLKDLPPQVPHAVLAAEDAKFYEHGGIDPSAIGRALLRNAQGSSVQGGSTITQQLAKINYTAGQRTVLRKLKEVLYATQLEKKYTKNELLERYLNQVYFGDGAYGIDAAAQAYFGVHAKDLTAAQAATLAGKIRSPEGLDPRKNPEAVVRRRNQVLTNMARNHWLSKADLDTAKAEPLQVVPPTPAGENTIAPHFVEFVKREANTLDALGATPETRANQLVTGGYTIQTTLDPKVFNATVDAVKKNLGAPDDPDTAVATVVPGDGAIRNLFGGLDFSKTQYDMSSLAGRQAGSSFKPFSYLAGLRQGIDPRTTYDGTSGQVIPCYGPQPVNNYAGEDGGGTMTVDEALVHSINVVFVHLACDAGPKNVLQAARDAGVPDDATGAGGAILGGLDGKGVNTLEMAAAYATFAAKGVYAKPYAISGIKDDKGKVIYLHKPETRQAFKPEEVGVLNNPLQDVVRRGTGVGANIGRPLAGKTGTTENSHDAWFDGFTPQLATSVWVGYSDSNRPMDNVHGVHGVTGGTFPARIFSEIMRPALEGVPVQPIFTASPDQLNLHLKSTNLPPPGDTTTTTPADTTTTSSTPQDTTTTTAQPTTTTTAKQPPPKPTTTTSSTSATTSSTATTSTTVKSGSTSGGTSGATTTTTAP
ncbi:MAG TPA: transglycosylase domain-containing protein [Acidimicrobiales bacterium]|nr:transglycosylase domain-containing protein [Acidimicrobiales bacterium]